MVDKYPKIDFRRDPSTDERKRSLALKGLSSHQTGSRRSMGQGNAPTLLKHLETAFTELPFYRGLLSIIAEYAVTWIIVSDGNYVIT